MLRMHSITEESKIHWDTEAEKDLGRFKYQVKKYVSFTLACNIKNRQRNVI